MSDVIPKDKSIHELNLGDSVSFEKIITDEDVSVFSKLSGDFNPLHTDASYAEATPFRERVVFGMLLGAYVSRLIGMELPGTRALILKESLEFKKPVHIGDTITVTGKIVSKSESVGLIEVGVSITVKGEITTQGSVHVRVRS